MATAWRDVAHRSASPRKPAEPTPGHDPSAELPILPSRFTALTAVPTKSTFLYGPMTNTNHSGSRRRGAWLAPALIIVAALRIGAATSLLGPPGCAGKTREPTTAMNEGGATPTSSGVRPSTATSPAAPSAPLDPKNCRTSHQLEADGDLQRLATSRSRLGVVRLAPTATLPLRQSPSASAETFHSLSHDAVLDALGEVCVHGDVTWVRVRTPSHVGWVDSRFAMPVTVPRDETDLYVRRLGPGAASSPDVAARTIAGSLDVEEGSEVPLRAEVVGIATRGTSAYVELWECCFADDSVMAKQVSIELRSSGEGWSLVSARSRDVCRRGVSGRVCS